MERRKEFEDLANNIVRQAVVDYTIALRKNDTADIKSLERFFNGEWCYQLCNGVSGSFIMNKARETVRKGRFYARVN